MIQSKLANMGQVFFIVVAVAAIGYLNFALIRFWFIGEFNQNMGSIEISYIQMAKFWVEGAASGGWQPLWYLGHPWHVFYTPLLPALEVLANQVLDWSFAHAYRVITGAGFVLVPISLYFFVWQIGRSKTGAAISAFFYSFVPSIIAVLFNEVAADRLSAFWEPRRFAILVRWGEGPHTLALVFLPLFGLFLSRFLESRRLRDMLAASLFLALVALTNALVIWPAMLLVVAFALAALTKKSIDLVGLVKSLLALGILTFGLLAFWYNEPFLTTFFREGGGPFSNWLAMLPWGLILFLAAVFLIFILVKKITQRLVGGAVAIFWFLMLFAIVFVYYASGDSQLEYVPQALRLTTEVDLALAVLVGVVISNIYLWLLKFPERWKLLGIVGGVLIFILPAAALFIWGMRLAAVLPTYTKPLATTAIGKIENTTEFKVAQRLKELRAGSDARVLAPGNYGFWLNYFIDTPQLRGALWQSSTHFWPEHIYYQITNGTDSAISLAWLKIANIGKVVYTTGGSAEPFKDFKVPQSKFEGIMTVIDQQNGDIYYDVPLKNDSLAKIVDAKAILAVERPTNAIDERPLFAYADLLEKSADTRLNAKQIADSGWRISGEIGEGEAVLVQQTYDAGWDVVQGGWKVVADPLGFTLLVPKKAPPSGASRFEIDLIYRRPLAVWLGYLLTFGTVVWIGRRLLIGRTDFLLMRLIQSLRRKQKS